MHGLSEIDLIYFSSSARVANPRLILSRYVARTHSRIDLWACDMIDTSVSLLLIRAGLVPADGSRRSGEGLFCGFCVYVVVKVGVKVVNHGV